MEREESLEKGFSIWKILAGAAAAVMTVSFLCWGLVHVGVPQSGSGMESAELAVMDRYDMLMTNQISTALDGVLSIEKVYWLNDFDTIAPEPDQSCYGVATDPAELEPVLREAAELLDIETFIFRTDIKLRPQSKINWYLDETIFAITWQEVKDGGVYTFSEIKIAHPSQIRRFLAGGTYGYDKQFLTTQMAADVNAVVASSGDFYKYRPQGIVVQNGQVYRSSGEQVDTCFIDDKGDMILVEAGTLTDEESVRRYVEEHNIRFSLSFGPILIRDGERCEPATYALGEINQYYPRAALCQAGERHYLLAVANSAYYYAFQPNLHGFAARLHEMGVQTAYTLDGGQTGVIVMNDEMMSLVQYGSQRYISDIFYFATAMPEGG